MTVLLVACIPAVFVLGVWLGASKMRHPHACPDHQAGRQLALPELGHTDPPLTEYRRTVVEFRGPGQHLREIEQ